MIIVACMILFEAEQTLAKCLRSITPFVDRAVFINGAYEGRSDHIDSKDGTETIERGFQKPYILQRSPPHFFKNEVDTRNQYLFERYLDEGDWVFTIDADEYVESGIEETLEFLHNSKESCHSVHRVHHDKHLPDYARTLGDRVQLFRYVPGMMYYKNHYTIKHQDGSLLPLKASLVPLVVCHDRRNVLPNYREAMDRYNREIRFKVESDLDDEHTRREGAT